MRAGSEDPVTVKLEWDRKVFGPITGQAGKKPKAVGGPTTGEGGQ